MQRLLIVLPIAGLVLAGCGGAATQESASTTETTTSTTTTPPTSPPLAESALDGLLLSPADVDAATGLSGMTVAATSSALATDIQVAAGAPPEKVACIGVAGTAEAQAYAGAGSTAVRDQLLQTPGENGSTRTAGQSVILFDSPEKAAAFATASTEKWSACKEFAGTASSSTVASVGTDGGMLRATITTTDGNGNTVDCQRALTAANNVVVEASACSATAPDAAVAIARQIAAKATRG